MIDLNIAPRLGPRLQDCYKVEEGWNGYWEVSNSVQESKDWWQEDP